MTTENKFYEDSMIFPRLTPLALNNAWVKVKESPIQGLDPLTHVARICTGFWDLILTSQQRERIKILNLCNAYGFSKEYTDHLLKGHKLKIQHRNRDNNVLMRKSYYSEKAKGPKEI